MRRQKCEVVADGRGYRSCPPHFQNTARSNRRANWTQECLRKTTERIGGTVCIRACFCGGRFAGGSLIIFSPRSERSAESRCWCFRDVGLRLPLPSPVTRPASWNTAPDSARKGQSQPYLARCRSCVKASEVEPRVQRRRCVSHSWAFRAPKYCEPITGCIFKPAHRQQHRRQQWHLSSCTPTVPITTSCRRATRTHALLCSRAEMFEHTG